MTINITFFRIFLFSVEPSVVNVLYLEISQDISFLNKKEAENFPPLFNRIVMYYGKVMVTVVPLAKVTVAVSWQVYGAEP